MDKLDGLVIQHIVERLLHPQRLAEIRRALKARPDAKAEGENNRIMTLQHEADADDRLKRLHQQLEDGITDLDDMLEDQPHLRQIGIAQAALEAAKAKHSAEIRN